MEKERKGWMTDVVAPACRSALRPCPGAQEFTDGNGRTGRALAQSMLRRRGVTRVVAVPVSAGLLADVDGYHAALTAYRVGDLDPIVETFAHASLRAVNNARDLIAELDGIVASWHDRLRVRRDSNAWRLLDVISRHPVIDAATAAAELGIQRTNAYAPWTSSCRPASSWRCPSTASDRSGGAKRCSRRSTPSPSAPVDARPGG